MGRKGRHPDTLLPSSLLPSRISPVSTRQPFFFMIATTFFSLSFFLLFWKWQSLSIFLQKPLPPATRCDPSREILKIIKCFLETRYPTKLRGASGDPCRGQVACGGRSQCPTLVQTEQKCICFNRQMGKQIAIILTLEYYSAIKRTGTCHNSDKPQKYYAK